MSQENVERWRTRTEAVLAGTSEFDPEATISKLAELWDPEMEMDASEAPALDISGVYRGKEAVGQWWREWFAAWETLRFEYELVDAGDRAVMLLDLRVRGRSTGIEVPFGKHAWVATSAVLTGSLALKDAVAKGLKLEGDRASLRRLLPA
jgi:hypothetical protein